jgi:uroporphyrinogen decarboxylase
MDTMSPRERFACTMRHEYTDRMIRTLDTGASDGIAGPYVEKFRSETGAASPADHFDFDIRPVSPPLTPGTSDYSGFHPGAPSNAVFDEMGVGWIKSVEFPMGLVLAPWKGYSDPGQIYDYPMPCFSVPGEYVAKIRDWKARGYVVSSLCGALNESCYFLRDMEEFLIDLVQRPEMAEAVLARVGAMLLSMGTQMAEAGADIVCFYGDVGGQSNLLCTPRAYRRWFKPHLERIFAAAHHVNPEVKVFFHTCGHVLPIIPDLIEIGVDILNPIQPESMDPFRVKKEWGQQVVLWGGIGLQETMAQPSAELVRERTARLVQGWAPGGGAIACPSNVLPIDVPWANVVAFLETAEESSREEFARLRA